MIYLGLNIKGNSRKRTTCIDVLTRLFLSYDISAAQSRNIYRAFESGHSTVQKICELTDGNIQTVLAEFSKKRSLSSLFASKAHDWITEIGDITEDDFNYIYDRYGLTYESIMGYPFFFSAEEMANYAKKTIKGQDEAIDEISGPFFSHYAQIVTGHSSPLNNTLLLTGATGTGKTETVSLFAEMIDCPLVTINSSECTATGWRGASIYDVLANSVKKYRPEELSRAILYIDEVDKITHNRCNEKIDDLGFDIQREIMNLTDGRHPIRLNMGLDKSFRQSFMELSVDKMLIVFSGAFTGIDKIIEKRLNISSRVGFATSSVCTKNEDVRYNVTAQDLSEWGFLDELIGRIGRIVTLKNLDENDMYEILTESRRSILHSQASYSKSVYNATLRFTEGALRMICAKAKEEGLGFRGVQTLLSKCLSGTYYNMNIYSSCQQTIDIDECYISKNLNLNLS